MAESDLDLEKQLYIEKIIKTINFGSIVITVHNGAITQIDYTEKIRFANTNRK
ncbi:YezD family protein [Peribacillus kribbensis]|uniref:YezD family protein n=1 Tax=Peribacillus kribbensis TaxID=356658 RepID=UPI000404C815|nr:YezD family protein [Peribacillus kribbensis]